MSKNELELADERRQKAVQILNWIPRAIGKFEMEIR